MNAAQPIRQPEDLENIKEYYKTVHPDARNALLIITGLNTALRISDILSLCWGSVYDFEKSEFKSHILITEQKTGKKTQIYINRNITDALSRYQLYLKNQKKPPEPCHFLFRISNKNIPISRVQAFRIIKDAANYYKIPGISCHSLRKTFGYYAWKQGISPALLMDIYNHSSYQVTKRYLGIGQDDRDQIFKSINL